MAHLINPWAPPHLAAAGAAAPAPQSNARPALAAPLAQRLARPDPLSPPARTARLADFSAEFPHLPPSFRCLHA